MPSISKTQQRLMGQAYAYKTGEIKAKDLNPEYASEIKKLAKSMTEEQLRDFAKTKHKNLPEKVEEKIKRFDSFNESGESGENERVTVRVKDIVEYLNSLDPEMEVYLDKDGWDYYETGLETVKKSFLFDVFDSGDKKQLFINN